MIALAVALAIASPPWRHPLAFRPLTGWHTGASGTVREVRNGEGKLFRLRYAESTAWISNVRYLDNVTTDPPQRTVHNMPPSGIVVWAVITPRSGATQRISLDLGKARHGLCCDTTPPPYTREWDLAGLAPSGRYDAIVRIYFGSSPTKAMMHAAQRALRLLVLPLPSRP